MSGSTSQKNGSPDGVRGDGAIVHLGALLPDRLPVPVSSLGGQSLSAGNSSAAAESFSTRILQRERVRLLVKEIEPALVEIIRNRVNKRFARDNFPHWHFWNASQEDVLCWANCRLACRFLKRMLETYGIKCTLKVNPAIPPDLVPYYFRRGVFPSPHVVLFCGDRKEGMPGLIIDPTWMQFLRKGKLPGLDMITVELPENMPGYVKELEKTVGQDLSGASLAEVWDWRKYRPLRKREWRPG